MDLMYPESSTQSTMNKTCYPLIEDLQKPDGKAEWVDLYGDDSVSNSRFTLHVAHATLHASFSTLHRRDLTLQWSLVPHQIDLLVNPILTLAAQLQIKVPQDFCQDESNLMIRHTMSCNRSAGAQLEV